MLYAIMRWLHEIKNITETESTATAILKFQIKVAVVNTLYEKLNIVGTDILKFQGKEAL